jgi:hypothetical protein
MRLLGVVIANGYSSEVRDFANIVAERGSWYDPLILFHEHANPHEKDRGAADELSRTCTMSRSMDSLRRTPAS